MPVRKGKPVHNANDPTSAAMKSWKPALQTMDDSYLPERDELVAKTDDAVRNSPMLAGGIRSQIDQVVGDNYRMSFEVDPLLLENMGVPTSQIVDLVDEVEEQFDVDANSEECWFDASGRMTLTELCACGMYTHYRQGEIVQMSEYLDTQRSKGNRPFATAVQLINPDRVITPFDKVEDKFLKSGFRYSRKGYAFGMFVLNRHPTDYMLGLHKDAFAYVTRHTPWGRSKWLHIMNNEACDQSRGRSSLIAGLKKERMLSKFEDTMLSNAITRAFYAAVIESDDPKTAYEGLALEEGNAAIEHRLEMVAAETSARANYYSNENDLMLNDSLIAHLYQGDKLNLLTPDGHVDFMDPFVATFMRHLARSLDITYEEFTGDYTKTNYSGARAGKIQAEAGRRVKAARVPAKQARHIATQWLEEQFSTGRIKGLPGRTSRIRLNNYLNNKDKLCKFDFHGPGIGHIDPVKGVKAAREEFLMGTLSRKKYTNTYHNQSYLKTLRQIALEKSQAKSMGIDLNEMLGVAPKTEQVQEAND